jgi:ubiquinone/menaquinone biosynthesis C-methylase UbiE
MIQRDVLEPKSPRPVSDTAQGLKGHLARRKAPGRAGTVYGHALSLLDRATLAAWSDAAGIKFFLAGWYARLFGYPELAAHRRFGKVRDALRRDGGRVVLDLGAGNGLYSVADAIARPGTLHIVADISFRHLRRARDTGAALTVPLWGVACSAESLPLATASVDSVLLIEVLQFLDDDDATIAEVARVLRPGGTWICEQEWAAEGASLARVDENRLRKRRVGYTTDELSAAAARAGLVLEWTKPVSNTIGRWWESVDGRLFRASRPLHLLLFPLTRLAARASTPLPRDGLPGTVLYLFRKPAANREASSVGSLVTR